ncbi:MAG: ABC transporter ATP-binding protein [Verrucomicrobiota bacterium]
MHKPIRKADSKPLPVLRACSLEKSFGERLLFSSVDIDIFPKQQVALLGPSGAGKSTLLNCLEGVEPYDAGSVSIGGKALESLDENEMSALRRNEIGTIFQFFHLLPTLTAFENIELALQLTGVSAEQRQERVEFLLNRLQIEHRSEAFPSQMSGGEMQRVAIARAIAHEPKILFADEPTGNLDSKSGQMALELLSELCQEIGAGLLMVTHSQEAASYCESQYSLVDGQLQRDA